MNLDHNIEPNSLQKSLQKFWDIALQKVELIENEYDNKLGSPVFTVKGKYTNRGWTDWTKGFQYGIPLLIFEATGNKDMLEVGKTNTLSKMEHHISHFGVHDHGFTIMSTYGNLLRLSNLNKVSEQEEYLKLYRMAIKVSGAVQAKRWTNVAGGLGFIYSFNGPHSLFIDTIRTCRILIAAHKLGHTMLEENDKEINLLKRALNHAVTTAKFAVYYGEGRDVYDKWGRVAHESLFNVKDGLYRCPNSQQGFSGYSTWTRGLSWAMLGFSELLEFLGDEQPNIVGLLEIEQLLLKAAEATCDFYLENSSYDGIPYWDTEAPNLYKLSDYKKEPANPNNEYEPIDSSAAAIGAQGLLRLSNYLKLRNIDKFKQYENAGLTILKTLLSETYLSCEPEHHGLLLHTIYHRPNGWDYIPTGSKVPNGESSMWGDYHLTELCLLTEAILKSEYYSFFKGIG